ncbi:MAG TPA: hypothetical protein VM012_08930 [Flavitalea sp.]|nr:hypothetical protein [Flavitalea sp.]
MKAPFLLPHRYKLIGWILFIPFLLLGILWRFSDFEFGFANWDTQSTLIRSKNINLDETVNFTDEIALTGIVVSLLFIAFAREKHEDEFINRTRLDSLQWAVIINYSLLVLAAWFVHGFAFIDVMMYNMLTVLILFIIRFHFVLRRFQKSDTSIPSYEK